MLTHAKPNINIRAVNFERGIFNSKYYETETIRDPLIRLERSNANLINAITADPEFNEFTHVELAIADIQSKYQPQDSDTFYEACATLQNLSKYLQYKTKKPELFSENKFVLADLFGSKNAGENFSHAQKRDATYDYSHSFTDISLFANIYPQLQFAAQQNKTGNIVFDYYHTNAKALWQLQRFLKINSDFIPKNMRLRLHQYNDGIINDAPDVDILFSVAKPSLKSAVSNFAPTAKLKPQDEFEFKTVRCDLTPIEGTGDIDEHPEQTLKNMIATRLADAVNLKEEGKYLDENSPWSLIDIPSLETDYAAAEIANLGEALRTIRNAPLTLLSQPSYEKQLSPEPPRMVYKKADAKADAKKEPPQPDQHINEMHELVTQLKHERKAQQLEQSKRELEQETQQQKKLQQQLQQQQQTAADIGQLELERQQQIQAYYHLTLLQQLDAQLLKFKRHIVDDDQTSHLFLQELMQLRNYAQPLLQAATDTVGTTTGVVTKAQVRMLEHLNNFPPDPNRDSTLDGKANAVVAFAQTASAATQKNERLRSCIGMIAITGLCVAVGVSVGLMVDVICCGGSLGTFTMAGFAIGWKTAATIGSCLFGIGGLGLSYQLNKVGLFSSELTKKHTAVAVAGEKCYPSLSR